MKYENTLVEWRPPEKKYEEVKERLFVEAAVAAEIVAYFDKNPAANSGDKMTRTQAIAVWSALIHIIEYSDLIGEFAEYMHKLRDEGGETWITERWCNAQ